MRTRVRVALALVAIFALPTAPAVAAAARASLTDIENDVMCVVCHEPLAVAQSPQADRERAYILALIHQGKTKAQIERELVAQYGTSVLGRPPAHGFSLALYIIPPALIAIGLVILALTLPRWRRRVRGRTVTPVASRLAVSPGEARRLDDELSRYDG